MFRAWCRERREIFAAKSAERVSRRIAIGAWTLMPVRMTLRDAATRYQQLCHYNNSNIRLFD